MFIGVLRLTLHLPGPGSLKSKRHLLRSAIDRVKARYNVSVAEVGDQDLWQRAVVGVAAVGNDHGFVNETLDKVAGFVAGMHGGQLLVVDREMEIAPWSAGPERTLAEAEAAGAGVAAGAEYEAKARAAADAEAEDEAASAAGAAPRARAAGPEDP